EFSLGTVEYALLLTSLILVVPIKMVVFLVGGLHKGWWRYAGLGDLVRIYVVNIAASGMSAIFLFDGFGSQFPRSLYVIDFLICFLLTAGARFCVRLYKETFRSDRPAARKGILIYGAGDAGRSLLREIRMNPGLGFHVVGFIDDKPLLRSTRV